MQKTSRRPTTALSFGNGPFPFNNPLLFVIPSVPGFPAALLSPATPDVVLFKENHTQPTEAENFDRKSGEAEASAVRHSGAPNLLFYNHYLFVILEEDTATTRPVAAFQPNVAVRCFATESLPRLQDRC